MVERNKYIAAYIDSVIKSFRYFNSDAVTIRMIGMKKFVNSDPDCFEFINLMAAYNFALCVDGGNDSISNIDVICSSNKIDTHFTFQLSNIPSLIEICSKTSISLWTLITMKIVSMYISNTKTIYKAFALDLDDTLWNGTLSEDGISIIKENLRSEAGKPFVSFMKFVCAIAKELGVFIAICSRNDASLVKDAIDELDEATFPLKNQIDCLVANNNDKSSNLIKIAEQLSILPNAMLFIDDNAIVRDEVRAKVPEIFVPEWVDHQDLILQIVVGGYFDRPELSISAQNRRRVLKIIHEERRNNSLPELYIKVHEDKEHIEAQKLYAKSNQFKLNQLNNILYKDAKSLYFELFRANGQSLGTCSSITYYVNDNECILLNWAISCRFFEIGLEEFVILYMLENVRNGIDVIYQPKDINKRVASLIDKYYGSVISDDCSSVPNDSMVFIQYLPCDYSVKSLLSDINDHIGSFCLYTISVYEHEKELLRSNTNLKIYNG